jgi:hypothetical protein
MDTQSLTASNTLIAEIMGKESVESGNKTLQMLRILVIIIQNSIPQSDQEKEDGKKHPTTIKDIYSRLDTECNELVPIEKILETLTCCVKKGFIEMVPGGNDPCWIPTENGLTEFIRLTMPFKTVGQSEVGWRGIVN